MAKILKGSCNHCGKCCLAPIVTDNPCTKLEKGKCDFYVEELNDQKFGHCLILGRGAKPITSVKDRKGNKITPEQIKWFEENCPNFPQANLEELENKAFNLPAGCGFSIEEQE